MPILTFPQSSLSASLNVHKISETSTTITLGWTTIPNVEEYIYTIDGSEFLTDKKRHFTFDEKTTRVTIGKPKDGKSHSYGVKALGVIAQGSVTSPAPAKSDQYSNAEYDDGVYE